MSVRTKTREFQCNFCQRTVIVGVDESPNGWEKFQRKRDDTTYVIDLCSQCVKMITETEPCADEET